MHEIDLSTVNPRLAYTCLQLKKLKDLKSYTKDLHQFEGLVGLMLRGVVPPSEKANALVRDAITYLFCAMEHPEGYPNPIPKPRLLKDVYAAFHVIFDDEWDSNEEWDWDALYNKHI